MTSSAGCLWKTFQEVVRTAHESLTLSPGRRSESARIAVQIDREIECSLDRDPFRRQSNLEGDRNSEKCLPHAPLLVPIKPSSLRLLVTTDPEWPLALGMPPGQEECSTCRRQLLVPAQNLLGGPLGGNSAFYTMNTSSRWP
jgi:hypothetical protein